MRLRTAFVVASWAAFAIALSQPPSPSATRQGAQQQESASQVEQQTPATPANQLRTEQTNQQEQATSRNELQGWILGLLTVGVGVLQGWVMHKQRQIAARQNEIIDTQTTHMESGLKVARDSADAATSAAVTAHRAVIIANPPKIIIREIRSAFAQGLAALIAAEGPTVKDTRALAIAVFMSPEERRITGSLTVMNKGKSHATVVASDCKFIVSQGLAAVIPCSDTADVLLGPKKLGPGHWGRTNIPQAEITHEMMTSLILQRTQLYVIGLIIYVDDLGNIRKTGFRRMFDTKEGRFVGHDKPDADWEYQD